MKMIYCPTCHDVRKIGPERTACECGESWGWYMDELNAVYGGRAVPLGIDNVSLSRALREWPFDADIGMRFEAFVVPADCPTFRWGRDGR